MSRTIQILLVVIAVVLAIGAAVLYGRVRTQNAQLASTQLSEQQAQDRYNRTIDAIAEIQDSLNAISVGPGAQIVPGNLRQEQNMGGPNGQQALDRIALLRSSIEANKERISQLEANLKKSGVRAEGLQKLIAGLKRTVKEKETQIAYLTAQVDTLHTQVNGLNETVAAREDTLRTRDTQLEDRRRELATIYYVVGNKDQLKKSGVIQTSGGVLGLGKTVLPAANPDPTAFQPIDTDQMSTIQIPSKNARVITAQPVSSYQLVPIGANEMELRITNPLEFRKIKQVVILTG